MLEEWRAALLRHTPPQAELVDAGEFLLGPAAIVAFAIFESNLAIYGKKAAVQASAWAMLVAFGVANYLRGPLPWLPDRPFQAPAEPWHWLVLLFVLFQHDGTFGSVGRTWRSWGRRLAVCGLAAWVFVPQEAYAKLWPLAVFGALIFIGWVGSEALSQRVPGGTVPLGLSFSLLGASFVVAHAHSARFADALAIPGAALFGIALVAFITRVDPSGAFAGVALVLPAVLLMSQQSTFSEISWYAFLLAAAPPVTIGLLAIPPLSRLSGGWRFFLFWVLCLGPTIAAVTLAVRAETLIEDW
jgi:hypothetical protein